MTKIEWTEHTWNVITGCNKISAGCANCYAADIAKRFWGDRAFSDVQFHENRLAEPFKRKKPTTYFVNSMSDLFHNSVTDAQLDIIFAVMALTPQHSYQVLTKRPERMLKYFEWCERRHNLEGKPVSFCRVDAIEQSMYRWSYSAQIEVFPLPNVLLGVTIENQKAVRDRSSQLHQLNQSGWKTFYSVEPLLESVDLSLNCYPVNWVIVGGESGTKARPFNLDWAREVQHQCEHSGIPYFFKQPGSNAWDGDRKLPKHAKDDKLSEVPLDLQIREFPTVAINANHESTQCV